MDFSIAKSEMEKKFFDLCRVVTDQLEIGLYDLVYVAPSKKLTLFIFNKESKTAGLEDCVKVDRALTDIFEQEKWIPEEITLEVSSPGLYRGLREKFHFEMAIGENIKIEFNNKIKTSEENSSLLKKKKIVAKLLKVEASEIEIEFDKKKYVIVFELIRRANLETVI